MNGLQPKDYYTLVIESSVCELDKGFIESFPNLKDLIVEADRRGGRAWTH